MASKYFRFSALDPVREQWQAIAEYNLSVRDRLPNGARNFVCSDWHYNYHDARCPHDSWITSINFTFIETAKLDGMVLKLLGAYHDRNIFIEYANVSELSFDGELISQDGRDLEWVYDEVHLLNSGRVEHVIEFSKCVMRIDCRDFDYRFEFLENL